jgi:ribonuclease PH
MTGTGGIVEVQATAEGAPYSDAELGALLALARKGTNELFAMQRTAIGG